MKYLIFLIFFIGCSFGPYDYTEDHKYNVGDCVFFTGVNNDDNESWEQLIPKSGIKILKVGNHKYLYREYMKYSYVVEDGQTVYSNDKTEPFHFAEVGTVKTSCEEMEAWLGKDEHGK